MMMFYSGIAATFVAIVLFGISSFMPKEHKLPSFFIGVLMAAVGQVWLGGGILEETANPTIPIGMQMEVVARYTRDDKIRVVVQWQEGEKKLDNEATVNLDNLKLENSYGLSVGDTILKMDDGTTIVLAKPHTTIDVP